MSDQPINELDTTANGDTKLEPGKAKKSRKPRAPRVQAFTKPATVADVAKVIAKRKGTDPNVEAKRLRGRIRANFDDMLKAWPELKKAGKANRDGNRYPAMPAKLANRLAGITKD